MYRQKLLLSFISFSLFIIFLIGIFLVFIIEKKNADKSMMTAEKSYLQKRKNFDNYISGVENRLFAVQSSKFFINYVRDANDKNLEMVNEAFFNIAHCSSRLMQLRYLDTEGMERIRVDKNTSYSLPYLLRKDELQNKKNRYYFSGIAQAPPNQVWYSRIDLNVENGEIEQPLRPVLRAGLAYYEHDSFQGVLIINILMKEFLQDLVASDEYDIYVVDNEDNILVSSDHQYDWSKYLDQQKYAKGELHFSDLKLKPPFYSNTLGFENGEGLKLIMKPRETMLMEILKEEYTSVFLLLLFVSILSVPLAHLFSKYPAKLEKKIQEHNKDLQIRIDKAVELYKENEKMLLHQHRLAQMGGVISMIAHQWRQPIATISAITAGLRIKLDMEENCDKELFEERLSSIEKQAQNLSNIISGFKDFYLPNAPLQETSLDEMVESSLHITNAQLKEKEITVHTDLNAKEVFSIHANHLKQAIVAILQNAQEAYEEQTNDNKLIEIRTYIKEGKHVLEISDQAGGIPEAIIEEIFVPYFSTKKSKNGTGLGLYMTKMIIEKHCHGTITVHNSNNGAVFTITV